MRHLSIAQVIDLHVRIAAQDGTATGIRDMGALEAAVAQPRMTVAGQDAYESIGEKAAALGFSIIANHPFVDGNKRVGHAAMETFLMLNGWELSSDIGDAESTILRVAAGESGRAELTRWVEQHLTPIEES